jgi:hypothetical protein
VPREKYEGVRPIHIYLLRLLYILMFFVLGRETREKILTHQDPWEAAAFEDLTLSGGLPELKEQVPDCVAGFVSAGAVLVGLRFCSGQPDAAQSRRGDGTRLFRS